jgi:ribosomal protein L32
MSSHNKRDKRRAYALDLVMRAKEIRLAQHVCEHCGKNGGHWITVRPLSLQGLVTGVDDSEGFWTCDSIYVTNGIIEQGS